VLVVDDVVVDGALVVLVVEDVVVGGLVVVVVDVVEWSAPSCSWSTTRRARRHVVVVVVLDPGSSPGLRGPSPYRARAVGEAVLVAVDAIRMPDPTGTAVYSAPARCVRLRAKLGVSQERLAGRSLWNDRRRRNRSRADPAAFHRRGYLDDGVALAGRGALQHNVMRGPTVAPLPP